MGFLNNTTVTVDAILTKKGRELLAQGTSAFQITKFALADDEVDYRLFDTSHPNGSDYYGAVIESMPLLEAFPDENHVMRYKLVTLPKNTVKMPILSVSPNQGIVFETSTGLGANPETVGGTTTNATDTSYTFILKDQTVASMTVAVAAGSPGTGATTPFFLGDDDAPNSLTLVAKSVTISVIAVSARKSTTLIVVGNNTGATASITIENKVTNNSLAAGNQNTSN